MIVGFTGTRRGMTGAQSDTVMRLLRSFHTPGAVFHHGADLGADHEASLLAERVGYEVVPHPGGTAKENIERNHLIVELCQVLFAAPAGAEVLRSGTWATIRFARGLLVKKPTGGSRPVVIAWPDGTKEEAWTTLR